MYVNGEKKGTVTQNGTAAAVQSISVTSEANDAIRLGDYVQMGTYDTNGDGTAEPILWRCVAFEKATGNVIDSTDTVTAYQDGYLPLMLADSAICNKAFDAAGSVKTGSHGRNTSGNFSRLTQGSNYWGDSNIRDWLKSEDDTVTYTCGNTPSYSSEKGFLTNFSTDEKNVIKSVEQKCIISKVDFEALPTGQKDGEEAYEAENTWKVANILTNYNDAYSEQLTDRVFLPDTRQCYNVLKNEDVLGSGYHNNRGDGNGYWLRTPGTTTWGVGPSMVYMYRDAYIIDNHGAYSHSAGVGNPWCVRPAFFLDTAASFPYGNGEKTTPYSFTEPEPHKHPVCGTGTCTDPNHTSHEDITWTAWESDNSLPTEEGNYYLTKDVVAASQFKPNGIKLCLNGHTVNFNAGDVQTTYIQTNCTFDLCDCVGNGKLLSPEAAVDRNIVDNSGTFNMYGGELSGKTSSTASGIGVSNAGTFNMYGGKITDNHTASGGGGGVRNYADSSVFNMYGGEISGNTARTGGGVHIFKGSFNMLGGKINGNEASASGGGIFADDAAASVVIKGEVSNNKSTSSASYGGGICTNAAVRIIDAKITGNTAKYGGGVCGFFSKNPIITVGGKTVISQNTVTDTDTASNLMVFAADKIAVDNDTPIAEGADIGVSYYYSANKK